MYLLGRTHFSGQAKLSRFPWSETFEVVFQSPWTEQEQQLLMSVLPHWYESVRYSKWFWILKHSYYWQSAICIGCMSTIHWIINIALWSVCIQRLNQCHYLTTNQKALTHVCHPNHQTRLTFMGRHHSMLAKLNSLTSFLWPSNLRRK